MRQQVPMVFLLLLVYLGAVAYISVEISLGSCWRRDILRVKGQAFSQITFFMTLCDMQSSSSNYSMGHQVPMVSLLLLVYQSAAVAYISVETSLGSCWCRDIFKGQRSRINHKLQLFMTLCDIQSSSGNYSMHHQVPMVSLLLFVNLHVSAVTCIFEERNSGPCWRKDILRVKGQA